MAEPFVEQLARARRAGNQIGEAPIVNLDEGYRIAAALAPMLGETIGWKVGATSPGAQAALRIEEPIRGRIFRAGCFSSPADLAPHGNRDCEAEPEIVLEAGHDPSVPARAFLGIEINRPSSDNAVALGAGFIVADNAAHVALVLGPQIPLDLLRNSAAIRVTLERNGSPAGEGRADSVLGGPCRSLAWLARCVTLRPGELVATGAITRSVCFAEGDDVVARFGDLGSVSARWLRRSEVMSVRR